MAVEMKYGDYVKGGWEVVKPNLVASIVMVVVVGVLAMTMIGALLIPQVMVNYLKGIKEAKASGKAIEIGALFNFDNFVNILVATLIAGALQSVCFLLAPLVLFVPAILADKPGISFMDAVKAALAFGKANYVPSLILMLVMFLVIMVAEVACVLPVLVAFPVVMAAQWLAYEDHKAAVHAAAAESGVTLA